MTLPWLAPASKLGVFFSRPSVRTAITCYIIVRSSIVSHPPSISVRQLGYERVLLNMGVLTAAFAVLGLILVGIERR